MKAKQRTRSLWKRLSNLLLVTFAALLLDGCHVVVSDTSGGTYLSSISEVGPVCPTGKETAFCVDGTSMPCALSTSSTAEKRIIEIRDGDTVIDREQYELRANSLSVREAGDEVYDPPIDILRIPMYTGDTWKWEGSIVAPSSKIPCSAEVTTEDAQLPYLGKSVPAVLATVELNIMTKTPRSRKMKFWITKEHGLLKREFGTSIRQPKQ